VQTSTPVREGYGQELPARVLRRCILTLHNDLKSANSEREGEREVLTQGPFGLLRSDCSHPVSFNTSTRRQGVMHNDLKSANLLVDRAGCLKVCDFGMSRLHGRQNPEQELHSPAWMAPEVLRGDAYNASADVYSFGTRSLPRPPRVRVRVRRARIILTIVARGSPV
jgi:serine/threonine protein kinase